MIRGTAWTFTLLLASTLVAAEPDPRAEAAGQARTLRIAAGRYLRAFPPCGISDRTSEREWKEIEPQLAGVTDLAAAEVDRLLFERGEFSAPLFYVALESGMSDAAKLAFARRAALLPAAKLPDCALGGVASALRELGSRLDLPLLAELQRRHPLLVRIGELDNFPAGFASSAAK